MICVFAYCFIILVNFHSRTRVCGALMSLAPVTLNSRLPTANIMDIVLLFFNIIVMYAYWSLGIRSGKINNRQKQNSKHSGFYDVRSFDFSQTRRVYNKGQRLFSR